MFKLCEAENINFVEYFVIGEHFFEQIFRKIEPESFLYGFLNSRDPLYALSKIEEILKIEQKLLFYRVSQKQVSKKKL